MSVWGLKGSGGYEQVASRCVMMVISWIELLYIDAKNPHTHELFCLVSYVNVDNSASLSK
jgi:hypothetical protein